MEGAISVGALYNITSLAAQESAAEQKKAAEAEQSAAKAKLATVGTSACGGS